MSPRTTAILAALALLLGAFVYLYEIEGEVERAAAEEDAKRIHTGFEAGDVEAVALVTRDGVEARFERRDGRWHVVAPVEGLADATALDAIASALAQMPREGTVSSAGDLAGFGLGPDARVVRFRAAGADRGLRVGRTTPVGGHRYVARLADDEVAYVASYRVNAFDRNLDDLRERRIFGFEPGDIVRLALRVPAEATAAAPAPGAETDGFAVEVVRDGVEDEWRLTSPIEGPADAETVRDLLSDLAYLRAADFVDERDASIEAALAETAIAFRLTRADPGAVEGAGDGLGDAAIVEARLAGEVEGGRLLVAPGDRLYVVPAERLEDFPRELFAYRRKRLADFEVAAARRLELELAEPTGEPLRVVARLEDAGWTSADRPLDPDAVSDLIRVLSRLDADGLVAEEMGEAERASLGLAPPRARLRVEGHADPDAPVEALATLALGRLDPDRGLFLQRADDPAVYRLDPILAETFPLDAATFRARYEAPSGEADAEGEVDDLVGDAEADAADDFDEYEARDFDEYAPLDAP